MILKVGDLVAAQQLSTDTTLDAIAGVICEEIADSCGVALLSPGGHTLHPLGLRHREAEVNVDMDTLPDLAWSAAGGASEKALAQGEPVLVTEFDWTGIARRHQSAMDLIRRIDVGTAILAPMRAGGDQVGILLVGRARSSPAFDSDDLPYVQALADAVGFAIATFRMREELEHLRGAPNRDAWAQVTTPLTDREGEILGLIARGLTNREIAEQIYLSVRTVEWHRSRLAAKLGVSSRSELVAMARGLLP